MVTVKRYGNRRLYDTSDSRYITLGEIAAKIRAGDEVRIIDAKTEADLTPEVLAQIIFEDRDAARLLPVTLLHQLIRMGDDALAEFFGRYLVWALDAYLQARQGFGAFPTFPSFASAAFGGLNPFGAPRAWGSDEVAALRREVEELKRKMNKPRR